MSSGRPEYAKHIIEHQCGCFQGSGESLEGDYMAGFGESVYYEKNTGESILGEQIRYEVHRGGQFTSHKGSPPLVPLKYLDEVISTLEVHLSENSCSS